MLDKTTTLLENFPYCGVCEIYWFVRRYYQKVFQENEHVVKSVIGKSKSEMSQLTFTESHV